MAAWIAPVSLPLPVPPAPKSRTLTWADSPVPRRTRERSNGAMSAPVLLKSARLERLMSGFLQVSNQPQLVWISISWRQIRRPIPEIVTLVTRSDEYREAWPGPYDAVRRLPRPRFHPIRVDGAYTACHGSSFGGTRWIQRAEPMDRGRRVDRRQRARVGARSTFALYYVAMLEEFAWGRGPTALGYSL